MASRHRKILARAIAAILFVGIVYGLNSGLDFKKPGDILNGVKYEKARVVEIVSDTHMPDPDLAEITIGIQTIVFEVMTGEHSGKTVTAKNFITRADNRPASVGTVMILATFDGFATATVEAYSNEGKMYGLIAIFVALTVIFGGKKGAGSIVSLAFTIVAIVFVFIPMILRGVTPVLAAAFCSISSCVFTFVVLTGAGKKTLAATLGVAVCTCAAALLALVAARLCNITSFNTPETEDLIYVSVRTSLQARGILFAGILFSSLGAVMDTCMSVTSAVFEIASTNPESTQKSLMSSGMNIGRDMMGTMTNTLILAVTGHAINMFVLYYVYRVPYIRLINTDEVLILLIEALCGSVGVIASIPFSAALSSRLAAAGTASESGRDNGEAVHIQAKGLTVQQEAQGQQ